MKLKLICRELHNNSLSSLIGAFAKNLACTFCSNSSRHPVKNGPASASN